MQLISKFNKGIRSLLCVIYIFSKYAWVVPLNDKKGVTIVNAFQKSLDDSVELRSMELHSIEFYPKSSEAKSKGQKPNKIWVDKGSEFYNRFF